MSSTALSGYLKVTPAELKRQSSAVSTAVKNIQSRFTNIEEGVRRSSSYWNGDAADAFRSVYEGYKDEIAEIISRLSEHIVDLERMAGVYEEAESAAEEIIESLPSDVIV